MRGLHQRHAGPSQPGGTLHLPRRRCSLRRGAARFLDDKGDTLLNPTMIVEVLSTSTESYDRGDKFMHYRRLESLREYVVVAQEKVLVERFTRQGDEWLLTEFRKLDETLRLASIDCAVPLREIYARIEFPAEDAAGA